MRRLVKLLPLQFRVLYRQSLLRVVDLEALSVEADVPRFLGQFASLLVFYSMARAIGVLMAGDALRAKPEAYESFVWQGEQAVISATMLLVGLVAVVSWDAIFPDRRDVMVLAPLPVASHTVLLAKVAASASLLGLAVLTLNFAMGVAWSFILGAYNDSSWGFLQSFAAYWFTIIAASVFLFCSVLALQGITALLLPRWLFLRCSALLQMTAFGFFLGVYFLQPSIPAPAVMAVAGNRWVAFSPLAWFFALFNQLNGSLPSELAWVAWRGWISLAVAVSGAIGSLLLCYLRTMKNTLEQPDLVPGARGTHWAPPLGSPLQTAIVLFSLRSLTRSRQHRLVFGFYLALIFSVALSWLRIELSSASPTPLNADFLISTFMMMGFAVFGLRSVFSLPISLAANWVLRITQLCPSEKYVAATRRTLLLLGVAPVWTISALLSMSLRPVYQVAGHLAVLAVMGWIFVELSLIGLYKVPFTCSYLPGKVHVQVVFWSFLSLMVVFALLSADYEMPSLSDPSRFVFMFGILASVAIGQCAVNRRRAKSAVLYFEELPAKAITTLGLIYAPVSKISSTQQADAHPELR